MSEGAAAHESGPDTLPLAEGTGVPAAEPGPGPASWPAPGPAPESGRGDRYPLQGVLIAGRYRLEDPLGRGGVADVYRALDESLGRRVAVKVFRPGTGPELGEERRFTQEARTLAGLTHRNLVTLYDAGVEDGRAYLVLRLVDGTTLSDLIQRGPLPPEEVARIGAALAEALGCVHAHKVVHRDVKPSNVLLEADGGVYLTDFGIARMVDATGITATGMLVGTAAYLSPEQVAGLGVERASDVYALGLVLLESLTGRRVYEGNATEVAVARLTNPPQIPDDFGPGWSALLGAMTARDPQDRPSTRAVAGYLDRLAAGDQTVLLGHAEAPPLDATVPVGFSGRPSPPRRRRPRLRSVLALVAGFVLGAAALFALGAMSPRDRGGPPQGSPSSQLPSGSPSGPTSAPGSKAGSATSGHPSRSTSPSQSGSPSAPATEPPATTPAGGTTPPGTGAPTPTPTEAPTPTDGPTPTNGSGPTGGATPTPTQGQADGVAAHVLS